MTSGSVSVKSCFFVSLGRISRYCKESPAPGLVDSMFYKPKRDAETFSIFIDTLEGEGGNETKPGIAICMRQSIIMLGTPHFAPFGS
jgi:hypothetical protein